MPKHHNTVLDLDGELIDDWTVETTFRVGKFGVDKLVEFTDRDAANTGPQNMFYMNNDNRKGTLMLLTNTPVHGSQETSLRRVSQRYQYVLGELATRDRLLVSRMNLTSVISAVLSPYIPDHVDSLDALEVATDEEWDRMGEAPDPPWLDVTQALGILLDQG